MCDQAGLPVCHSVSSNLHPSIPSVLTAAAFCTAGHIAEHLAASQDTHMQATDTPGDEQLGANVQNAESKLPVRMLCFDILTLLDVSHRRTRCRR